MDSENTHHHEMKKKLKKRRKRTVITADEMVILESSFKNENRPDRFAKMRLAKQLGKNENFISIWFQNRRARERREKRLSASETTESSRDNIDPILLTKAVHSSYETEDQPLDLSKKPCSSNEEQIETLDTVRQTRQSQICECLTIQTVCKYSVHND